ncbi:MAG: DUF3467 domain-containing protein [Acidobacteriia bacterium]|nr:DUF3467 domain-containing protein [Terriglobia bacterium]
MPKKKQVEQDAVSVVAGTPGVVRRAENAPMVPQLYANGFQIVLGPLDVRMYMIETFPTSPTEIVDRRLLSVIMTPETLKLLADNLHKYVESYEKQFGKLRDIQSSDKARIIIPPDRIS